LKPRLIAFILPVIWAIVIYVLLTMPNNDIPKLGFLDAIHFDKWVHAGLFAMLTFLFCWPFRKLYPAQHNLFVSIAVLALLYGITMEYVQKYFTTDRDYDINDMFADGFGCLVGYIAIRYIVNRIRLRLKNKPL
jgi:VanZ family protein